jgi:hypothetical protein
MGKQIKLEINCGDKTCQKETIGECRFHDGKNSICTIFNRYLENSYNDDRAYPDSLRCPECLTAEVV